MARMGDLSKPRPKGILATSRASWFVVRGCALNRRCTGIVVLVAKEVLCAQKREKQYSPPDNYGATQSMSAFDAVDGSSTASAMNVDAAEAIA